MSKREEREEGASIVRMDMRYMWSAIDSPLEMPKRRQPSRGVVFRRVRRWRKGIGVVGAGLVVGAGERVERTVGLLTVLCAVWGGETEEEGEGVITGLDGPLGWKY